MPTPKRDHADVITEDLRYFFRQSSRSGVICDVMKIPAIRLGLNQRIMPTREIGRQGFIDISR